jgi:hypothetical protein
MDTYNQPHECMNTHILPKQYPSYTVILMIQVMGKHRKYLINMTSQGKYLEKT